MDWGLAHGKGVSFDYSRQRTGKALQVVSPRSAGYGLYRLIL
jgi:hypothetical protein